MEASEDASSAGYLALFCVVIPVDRRVLVCVCQVILQMPLQLLPHLALNSYSPGLFQLLQEAHITS